MGHEPYDRENYETDEEARARVDTANHDRLSEKKIKSKIHLIEFCNRLLYLFPYSPGGTPSV